MYFSQYRTYSTLHYSIFFIPTKLHVQLHYANYTTPRLTAPLQYDATLIAPPEMQLQLPVQYTIYATPQLHFHCTTTTATAAAYHTTSSTCGWGDRPGDHCHMCNHSKNPTNFQSISGFAHGGFATREAFLISHGFPSLKFPPPPVAVLLVYWHDCIGAQVLSWQMFFAPNRPSDVLGKFIIVNTYKQRPAMSKCRLGDGLYRWTCLSRARHDAVWPVFRIYANCNTTQVTLFCLSRYDGKWRATHSFDFATCCRCSCGLSYAWFYVPNISKCIQTYHPTVPRKLITECTSLRFFLSCGT